MDAGEQRQRVLTYQALYEGRHLIAAGRYDEALEAEYSYDWLFQVPAINLARWNRTHTALAESPGKTWRSPGFTDGVVV